MMKRFVWRGSGLAFLAAVLCLTFPPLVPTSAAAPAAASVLSSAPERKRTWDPGFLASLGHPKPGQSIRFELVAGEMAAGTIRYVEHTNGQLIYVSGELTLPEAGRFFLQKQTGPGKAGDFVGVVEFPSSKKAYRIEPSGPNGGPELVEKPLDKVICLGLPALEATALQTEEIPPLDPDDHPDYPVPDYQDGIIPLQSLPGALGVLYIDYRGGYTPTWGGIAYEKPNVSNAQIKEVWKRVAEDFIPFNINVTTDIRVYEAAGETTRQRVVVTPTTKAAPGAGGVAFMNSWNWSGDTPCWSFYSSGKAAAEVITHEAGHTLQLGHDGRTSPSEGYFGGHGNGEVGWAPIMGVGYSKNVVQWSKGEYEFANNTEDDLALVVGNNNNVDYRVDDTGATLATSRYLEVYPGGAAQAEGVIETTGDADAFQFTTTGGAVTLRADPAPGGWANLAMEATLANASGTILVSNNVQSQLWASISTSVANGTYTFRVRGVGRNNPLTDGFSSYGSLGYYSITGTVANARLPERFTVLENSTNGTVVGTVVSTNSTTNSLIYSIVSGNTSGAFSLNNSGTLAVANSAVLNYEALARNTQLPVQYQLFVNITNASNPSLTELNRRVLVRVLDVNEPPTITGFTNTIVSHTRPGTVIGTVQAADVEYYGLTTLTILSGNSNNMFQLASGTGLLTVAGDPDSLLQNQYLLTIRVSDSGSPVLSATGYVQVTVSPNTSPFQPGSINYAVYDDIGSGGLISDLSGNARFPTDPTWEQPRTLFEGDRDRAENYGSVLRGYLMPPVSGTYTFWIASDDAGELRFSTTTNPAGAAVIASVSGWTDPRQWTRYASQKSAARSLVAGQAYYVEARQKEGGGGDHLAVAWSGPPTSNKTNVIPGLYLAPYSMNYLPHSTGFTTNVRRDVFPGTRLGRVAVADPNAADTHTFAILSGNTEDIFGIDPAGYIVVTNEAALQATATPSFTLSVRATDSGSPPLSATASVVLNIVEAEGIASTRLQREMFYNIGSGTAVSDLTGNAKFPGKPDALTAMSSFASAVDVADSYGSRVRGYVVPPVDGDYQFFIASDDNSQLKFSRTTNPANATIIASVPDWTDAQVWSKYASQRSALITGLVAGQAYYIEALQKEGGGGDHVSVAWIVPGSGVTNVIPQENLQPININGAPQMPSQTLTVLQSATGGTTIGRLTASDSPLDTLTFKLAGGNTGGTFAIEPATGDLVVADNTYLTNGAVSSFVLSVAVQDSGCGGLYPLLTSTGTVTVTIIGTGGPLVWTGASSTNRWSHPDNWGGVAPSAGARLTFGWANQQTNVNDLGGSLNWVQFTNGGFACAGGAVTLQSGLTNTGNNTWGINTTLAASQTWRQNSGELNVAGAISNAGFTLTLLANADLRVSGRIAGAGGLTKSGSARLLIQGDHAYTGPTTINSAGTTNTALEVNGANDLNLGGSSMTLNGRMDLGNHHATLGALNGNGALFANNGTRILTIGANNAAGSFSGTIQNSASANGAILQLVKTGAGAQTLLGANTHTGGTFVNQGTLNLIGGGTVFYGPVAVNSGATLAVDTSSGHKTQTNALSGSGTISKSGGNNLVLQGNNSFNGLFQVSGGSLVFDGVNSAFGQPSLNLVGGSLFVGSAYVGGVCSLGSLAGSGSVSPGYGATAGVRTLGINQTGMTTYSGFLVDGGGGRTIALQKLGVGTLVLNGANSYTGPTTVNDGTLALGPAGGIASSLSVTVASGAVLDVSAKAGWILGAAQTLQGNGTVLGTSTVNGNLRPGTSIGAMVFNGDLTLAGTTTMEISRNGSVRTNDALNVTGVLSLGGTLAIVDLGPTAFAVGDAFKLFNAASFGTQSFTNFSLPSLPGNFAWDISTLGTDGTLRVIDVELITPPTLAVQTEGSAITLSWPTNYTSYFLQAQTNAFGEGLGTNWSLLPGVTNNRWNGLLEPGHGSVFYRLLKP